MSLINQSLNSLESKSFKNLQLKKSRCSEHFGLKRSLMIVVFISLIAILITSGKAINFLSCDVLKIAMLN